MEAQVYKVLVHNFLKWNEPMSWLAWAIRKATGKYFNHAGIMITYDGYSYLIHAIYPRVVKVDFLQWLSAKDRDIEMEEVFGDCKAIIEKALLQVGKSYDWQSLLIYQPVYILSGGKLWLGKKATKADDRLYCYELVSYVCGEENSHLVLPYRKR